MKNNNYNFLIGPGNDDYGRKKPFWKIKQEVMEKFEKAQTEKTENSEMEKCILCGKETNYPVNMHIAYRMNYVEGAGQLCDECANKTYNDGPKQRA